MKNRPSSGNCSIRSRSTTAATVGLAVVTNGVMLPATSTCVVAVPTFRFALSSAVWPAIRVTRAFQASMPGASTEIS